MNPQITKMSPQIAPISPIERPWLIVPQRLVSSLSAYGAPLFLLLFGLSAQSV